MDVTKIEHFVGIDVAKNSLAVYFSKNKKYLEIGNDNESFEKYFSEVDKEKTLVILEGTGGYEYAVVNWLLTHQIMVHRTTGKKFKEFKGLMGKGAKTDKIDAKLLAEYGSIMVSRNDVVLYEQKDTDIENLKQIVEYINQLKNIRAAEKNKLKSPGLWKIKSEIEETIKIFDDRIAVLEEEAHSLLKENERLQQRVEILTKYKGVGEATALFLLLHLPELGKVKPKTIAALAGVAPYNSDSGKKIGYRSTKGKGRNPVKKALFISILSSVRYNEQMKKFYDSLLSRGKRKMVAIVACMRKMIVQLNAIMRDGEIRNFQKI